jgi:hypothetical protein
MGKILTQTVDKQCLLILVDLTTGVGLPMDQAPNPSFVYVDYVRAYERR